MYDETDGSDLSSDKVIAITITENGANIKVKVLPASEGQSPTNDIKSKVQPTPDDQAPTHSAPVGREEFSLLQHTPTVIHPLEDEVLMSEDMVDNLVETLGLATFDSTSGKMIVKMNPKAASKFTTAVNNLNPACTKRGQSTC